MQFASMLKAFYQDVLIEAGCDEAGRGCFAGPVFAAAVILPKKFRNRQLNDSKQLSADTRYKLRDVIEKRAISFAVAMINNNEIDEINILRASFKAMHQALEQLCVMPELILVDGHLFTPYKFVPHKCIVEGDGLYASIAAASILAKTYRDDYMIKLHEEFPHYNWKRNKGYGTQEHRMAIQQYGLCNYHRRSFNIAAKQIAFEFD